MTLHYKACGLSNVWLLNGYETHETKYGKAYSYEDIDGLYQAITVALCTANLEITPEVIRFLRKRLGCSQEEFGRQFGCTCQAVAKWEKGTSGIPVAVGRLVRLVCLERFAPDMSLQEAITLHNNPTTERFELEYINSKWTVAGTKMSTSEKADVFFEKFENGNQLSVAYVEDLMIKMSSEYGNPSFIPNGALMDSGQSYSEAHGSL
jgi:DNA-binding transcriptional regulator YiaG